MIPLIVDLESEWRGGQNQALMLLRGLYERGHAAELIAVKGSSLQHRARKVGIYVHTVSRKLMRLSAALQIRSVMSDGRIDIVHVNESHALTAAWLAGAHRKRPLVISRRVGYPIGKSSIARARFNSAAYILANSQWVSGQIIASGVDASKVRVVYEGANIPQPVPPEQREVARMRWRVASDTPLFGCVGVLLPDKGQDRIIRALAELRKDIPNARLLLAGDGAYRKELKQLALSLNLGDAVIFAGFVKDIETVYEALDVFLFPAMFEGLGTSLLTAMAYAIPSVAFRRCAFPEIIEHEKSGLLLEEPETNAIAAAMRSIVANPKFALSLGEEARKRIEQKFSEDLMVENTMKIYDELLRQNATK